MEIKDKVFVVTGGGNGIGRAIAENLLKKGSKVVITDISEEGLEETTNLLKEYSDSLMAVNLDVTDLVNVELLPNKVIERFGRVDGIINNAGIIQKFVRIHELDYKSIERIMNINFYGVLYMTKTFLPLFLESDEPKSIINVSSMAGFFPFPRQSIYGATKAAVKIFTEGLYAETVNTNVKVGVVIPGAVTTNITKNSGLEIKVDANNTKKSKMTAISADDAANIIIDAIEKGRYKTLVGKDASFMDKFYRISPKKAILSVNKKMTKMLFGE